MWRAGHGGRGRSVGEVGARAASLGDDVSVGQVPGGVREVALAGGAAREEYLAALTGWLVARLGRGPADA